MQTLIALPMCTFYYLYHCEMFWFRCVPMRSDAFRCIQMCSQAFQCVPMRSYAFRCVPMHSDAFRCIQMRSDTFRCVPMRSDVFRCVPMRFHAFRCVPMRCLAIPASPPHLMWQLERVKCRQENRKYFLHLYRLLPATISAVYQQPYIEGVF